MGPGAGLGSLELIIMSSVGTSTLGEKMDSVSRSVGSVIGRDVEIAIERPRLRCKEGAPPWGTNVGVGVLERSEARSSWNGAN